MAANIERELLNNFIDASVNDQARALLMLKNHPELIDTHVLHGETCLHHLAVEGFAEGVRFLAKSGFDVNTTNEFGDSPLVDAARISDSLPGCRAAAFTLLEFGAKPNTRSETGSPLFHAAKKGDVELATALLVAGADPNLTDEFLGPPLHVAIEKSRHNIVELLLEHGADPNYSIAFGRTAASVLHGEDDEIRTLLTKHGWRG